MAIAEAVVVERGLEVSRFPVDRVGIVLDDGGGDASGVVRDVGQPATVRIAGPVRAALGGLAHAADLRRRGRAEASKGVVQEDVNFVLLVDERVVVVALGALDVALAGVVVEGRVSDAAALLAAQALDVSERLQRRPRPPCFGRRPSQRA